MFKKLTTDIEFLKNESKRLLIRNKKEIENILENKTSYFDVIKKMEILEDELDLIFTQLYHLNSVKNTDESKESYEELIPIVSEYSTWIGQNKKLFDILNKIDIKDLTTEQQKVIEDSLLRMKLSGVDKNDEDKKTLEEINAKLSTLANEFSQNVLDATSEYELILESDKDIKEMPTNDLASAKCDEGYKFTLQMPSCIAFMTYCSSSSLREVMYKAYVTRSAKNEEIIEEILKLRDKEAKLLGFDNYSELSIAPKLANTTQEVIDFLEELASKSVNGAKKEFEELQKFAKVELNTWDTAYYSNKLKKERYSIDEEIYKEYFEKHTVTKGLFSFLSELFNLEFIKIDVDVWDAKVEAYEVKDDGKTVARLYMDLEARDDKRGGAWMNNYETHFVDINGKTNLASAYVVCNFAASTDDIPSLLRHDDVTTLFHEMGHALHHILSSVNERDVSGVNGVAWDGVEFPSQFLEEFAYEKDVLQKFAISYKSAQVISDEMIANLKRAKNFLSALGLVRQLEFSMFDFYLHLKFHTKDETQKLLDDVRAKVSPYETPEYNKFQNSFSHIFAGGYAAGYYSYKWAEVLSSDGFLTLIQSNFDKDVTQRYKEFILQKGGSENMMNLYKKFALREPKIESLLSVTGVSDEV